MLIYTGEALAPLGKASKASFNPVPKPPDKSSPLLMKQGFLRLHAPLSAAT